MPVMSLDECRPYLEPVAAVAVPTLFECQDFLTSVLDAHPELHDILDSSTKASMLSNIFDRMVRPRFADVGLDWKRTGRMQYGLVGSKINVRFKKLTLDLHSMNVPTQAQNLLYHQWRLPGFDDDLTQVTFGYIPDPMTRTIAAMFFVCPQGWRRNNWAWNLLDGDGGDGLFGTGPEPIDPDVVDPNLDVTVAVNPATAETA